MMNLKRFSGLVLIGLATWAFSLPAFGQRPPRGPGDGPPPPDGGRRGFGFDRGPGGRGGPPNFTPEERERFYDRMVERHMDRLGDLYELSDEQKTQVRAQLDQIRVAQRAYSEAHQQEFEALRNESRQMWGGGPGNGPPPDPEQARRLEERWRALREGSPLMNDAHVAGEVERILPPDQAARGHERFAAEQAERDQRRQEMRQRWENFRTQGGDPREFWRQQRDNWRGDREGRRGPRNPEDSGNPPPGDAPPPPPDAVAPEQDNSSAQAAEDNQGQDDGERRRDRRRGDWRRGGDDHERSDRQRDDRRGDGERRLERADPLGSWEQYERDFIRRYQLDAAQRETADSVLRDYLARRKTLEDANRTDIAAAQQIEDADRRREKLNSLNAPIGKLFEQFKATLDRIPTDAQRGRTDRGRNTTQPAAATSRPAEATGSRPAE